MRCSQNLNLSKSKLRRLESWEILRKSSGLHVISFGEFQTQRFVRVEGKLPKVLEQ